MDLAAARFDIGLATNDLEAALAFWRGVPGVTFDHALPIRRGHVQHRHDALGSVLKINHHAAPLPTTPPAGYRELLIASKDVSAVKALTDPDGARVSLVPPGHDGVIQIGMRIGVRDLPAHRRFYAEALGLPEERPGAFRAGQSLILLESDPSASNDAGFDGAGWRYITFQIFKVDDEHAAVLAKGGREALAPVTLGATARISMVRDPDGNWIELSQRASIVGSLG
jgi:catechol 2,3-dioxygenase-like lactoylglutathione lyase family enzyme